MAEGMASNWKKEIKMENIDIKEEIQKAIIPTSIVKDTCTVYIKEEDVKKEGKFSCKTNIRKL